jgi:AraC-like DNA-binding protein
LLHAPAFANVEAVTLLTVRHTDEGGCFERVECPPNPRLRGIVRRYAGYRYHSSQKLRRREAAQDAVTLILNLGPSMRVEGPTLAAVEVDSFIAPIADTYALTEEEATAHGLQVDLSPLGAFMLLGVPMGDLPGLVVPLEDIVGPAAPRLLEQLFLTDTWKRRFEVLDSFICARLEGAPEPSPDVGWAWRRLSETSGQMPIGALAGELGCSRRHLTARFRDQIGPTPKAVARIMRFQRAFRRIARDDGSRFAAIAQDCGYYDQAHLNRDFRELAGTTPGSILASLIPEGFGVSA